MPRARGSESEVPQRQSPRASLPIKVPSPDSDNRRQGSVKRNSISPKTVIRRSPPNPSLEKKRGTRISDLESKLGKSQNKVKQLKEQLVTAEAAKIEAEKELERTKKLIPQAETPTIKSEHEKITDDDSSSQVIMESSPETDVFIVQEVKPMNQISQNEENDKKCPESFAKDDISLGNELISELKAKLIKTEEELKNISMENDDLRKKVSEAMAESAMEASLAQAKEEEAAMKLRRMEQEIQEMKARTSRISELLEINEKSKEDLESEMKRLRIQTDQWRKAADAAANVLAMESDMNGPKVGERCGSMKKNVRRFETPGLDSYVSTLMTMDDLDDCLVTSKRKGGIRMFGDLWKKKAQK